MDQKVKEETDDAKSPHMTAVVEDRGEMNGDRGGLSLNFTTAFTAFQHNTV